MLANSLLVLKMPLLLATSCWCSPCLPLLLLPRSNPQPLPLPLLNNPAIPLNKAINPPTRRERLLPLIMQVNAKHVAYPLFEHLSA